MVTINPITTKKLEQMLEGEKIIEIKIGTESYSGYGKIKYGELEIRSDYHEEEGEMFNLTTITKAEIYISGRILKMPEEETKLTEILQKGALIEYKMEEGHCHTGYATIDDKTIKIQTANWKNKNPKLKELTTFEINDHSIDQITIYKKFQSE